MLKRRITLLATAAALFALFAAGCSSGGTEQPVDDRLFAGTEDAISEVHSELPVEEIQSNMFNGHRYEVYPSDGMSWEEIRDACESRGGCLATINSWLENEFLHNLCVEKGFSAALFGYYLNRDTGTWEWLSGESVYFVNWHLGEPNNSTGEEFYGMFYHGFDDGTWNDGDQADIEAYICEWD